MSSLLPGEQRKRIASFLAHQRTGIISTIASQGIWAMPVWYRPHSGPSDSPGPEVDCLVPRWSDVAHVLAQASKVLLIPRWLPTVQPGALYLVVRVTPSRIDLIDEELGWGVQETLEW
jgi:hypothetical protein